MRRYKLKVKVKQDEIKSANREEYVRQKCDKCVHYGFIPYMCQGPTPVYIFPNYDVISRYRCPLGWSYKSDPPDGGYYG
jgi:hypothetical protein